MNALRRKDMPADSFLAKVNEGRHMGEPLFAAWVVALAHNPEISAAARADRDAAILHYRWSALNLSHFFAAEGAWYEAATRPERPA
jgi:hypothetical protein